MLVQHTYLYVYPSVLAQRHASQIYTYDYTAVLRARRSRVIPYVPTNTVCKYLCLVNAARRLRRDFVAQSTPCSRPMMSPRRILLVFANGTHAQRERRWARSGQPLSFFPEHTNSCRCAEHSRPFARLRPREIVASSSCFLSSSVVTRIYVAHIHVTLRYVRYNHQLFKNSFQRFD